MQQEVSHIATNDLIKPLASNSELLFSEDYSDLLKKYNLEYQKNECYYSVGKSNWALGWIIDISVILIQIRDLLSLVIPMLIKHSMPFKIIRNSELAEFILDGKMGFKLLGKIVSIYPPTEKQALALAKELISLTNSFRGPKILTDRRLGGVIYTCYGASRTALLTNSKGINETVVYDSDGRVHEDPIQIPFKLSPEIDWPFMSLAPPQTPAKQSILHNKYKPMYILKEDSKGGVRKGLYLEKIWRVKWCVIKEARMNMNVDNHGRTQGDRLRWQYDVNKVLKDFLPLAEIFELFEENGDTYLIMEFIKGTDLDSIIITTFENKRLDQISINEWARLLAYGSQILDIIQQMHSHGYLHRDITPANFLVAKKQKLHLIDLELTYSLLSNKPYPPFRLGTPGFMSPEQESVENPTIEQDLFALGGTLITLMTGLLPGLLAFESKEILKEQLRFFIPDQEMIEILGDCLNIEPSLRPSIPKIRSCLNKYINKKHFGAPRANSTGSKFNPAVLKIFITKAIAGLVDPRMMSNHQIWVSKTDSVDGVSHQLRSLSVYSHFHQGISGVLFLLARAHRLGFSIKPCIQGYQNGMQFLRDDWQTNSPHIPSGLFFGSSGMALAVIEGIKSQIISQDAETSNELRQYLENDKTVGCGIVKGLAGNGVALISAIDLTGDHHFENLLQQTLQRLIKVQQKGGYWYAISDKSGKAFVPFGIAHGVSGILCFLMSYLRRDNENSVVQNSILKGMDWLSNQVQKRKAETKWPINNKTNSYSVDLYEGCAGIVLSFIRAYEIFGIPRYRRLAEDCLRTYVRPGIRQNISLGYGLTGIGESYLEADRVFKTGEWSEQAEWIARFLLHRFRVNEDDSYYWQADGSPVALPGLFEGNSGVIHFLLRIYQPGKLNHPLLN